MGEKEPVWAKYIKVDNMPNADMAIIAETMGLEVAKKFLFELRGINFSVPFNYSFKYRREHFIQNYDGTTASLKKLCRECDFSRRYAYKMVKELNLKKKLKEKQS